ncbi:MAG: cupin domain-containing protein [Muribaculaceae bacterium]|nr:cupin domain-containing protein [Muribaculaceae bacterium]
MKTNFKFGEVHNACDIVKYNSEKVDFLQIFETECGGVCVLAMKEGQKLDTHTAPFEVMVTVCEGEIEFTMIDKAHTIKAGEFLLMGADVAHSVEAKKDSKIMLIKVK